MASILITPLGKGNKNRQYNQAAYKFANDDQEYRSSLISAVLSERLKVDKIFMIGTAHSMWEEVFRHFGEVDQNGEREQIYFDLAEKITDTPHSRLTESDLNAVSEVIDLYLKMKNPDSAGGSVCKMIKNGVNSDELYENFSIFMELQKQIQPGDEIYLDITHSFRSIPLFMYVIVDFIQHLRKEDHIHVAGIYYGMLEERDSRGFAPVVDLSPLFHVTQWTKGVYDFVNYGNVHPIAALLEESEIKESMSAFSKLANLNYIKELRSEKDRLRHLLENASPHKQSGNVLLFSYLKPEIEKFVNYFKGASNDAEFQFKLAKWFFEHDRYSNGFICLAESMVTAIAYIYKREHPSFTYTKQKDRERIKSILERMKMDPDEEVKQVAEVFYKVKNIRNNIAHAGFERIEKYYEVTEQISKVIASTEKLYFSPHMSAKLRRLPGDYPI
jgi:CRISPR-associated Csx2 family protein